MRSGAGWRGGAQGCGASVVARRREAYDASPETAPPPLKLVLMSATLGLQKLGDYFGGCPSCSMGGTNFPVTTFFLEDVLKQTKY